MDGNTQVWVIKRTHQTYKNNKLCLTSTGFLTKNDGNLLMETNLWALYFGLNQTDLVKLGHYRTKVVRRRDDSIYIMYGAGVTQPGAAVMIQILELQRLTVNELAELMNAMY